jgi:hypothetical protein
MCFEYRRDRVAQKEISMSHDRGRNASFDRRVSGDAIAYAFEKLDLANRL